MAAQNGFGDVVKQLIAAKAAANKAETANGSTPLFMAAQNGFGDVAAKADVHQTTTAETGSYTALKVAEEESQSEIVAMLLAAGAK